ncbi:flagellar export chaperone FliS [Legionella sp. CNM-4043-24]|uniref:flagellar export chaperone FliS n=1 Tax=Legionella sp. CNM-4043-24 TaxID=3421646 RepID=UPI00403B0434
MNRLDIYNEIGAYSEVLGAPGHRQIQMLLEKLLSDINQSLTAMKNNNITIKCKCLASAGSIVSYLRDCLNFDADPVLSEKLDNIYEHLEKQLFTANAKNNLEALQECQTIAVNIKTWWDHVVA